MNENENQDEHRRKVLRAVERSGMFDTSKQDDPLWRLERLGTMLRWIFEHLAEVKIAMNAGPRAKGSELQEAAKSALGDRGATEFEYLDDSVRQAYEHYDALARLLRGPPTSPPSTPPSP